MAPLTKKQKAAIVFGAFGLVAAGTTGAAVAGGVDDDASDRPIEGESLQKATEAALEETGGGTVTETEADNDESPYEVEVMLEGGNQVEVELDENFQVLGSESDDDSDEASGDDD